MSKLWPPEALVGQDYLIYSSGYTEVALHNTTESPFVAKPEKKSLYTTPLKEDRCIFGVSNSTKNIYICLLASRVLLEKETVVEQICYFEVDLFEDGVSSPGNKKGNYRGCLPREDGIKI